MDTELDNQMKMGLNDMRQREIIQKVAFTNGLLNQLKLFTGGYDNSHRSHCNPGIHDIEINNCDDSHDENYSITYPMETARYNEALAQNALEKSQRSR